MALDAGNTEKLAIFRKCLQRNIMILPPDINCSASGFAVERMMETIAKISQFVMRLVLLKMLARRR